MTEGSETATCTVCAQTATSAIPKHNHNYVEKEKIDEGGVTMLVVECAYCANKLTVRDDVSIDTLNQPAREHNVPTDYTFEVVGVDHESGLRQQLNIINASFDGTQYEDSTDAQISYDAKPTGNGTWSITPTTDYQPGTTYVAKLSGNLNFSDYHGDQLYFSTGKENTCELEFHDQLKLLAVLDSQNAGYFPYELQYSDASQYVYAILGKVDDLAIGDIVCVGNILSEQDLLTTTVTDCFFGKIHDIIRGQDGRWTLVMMSASIDEVFSKYEIYQDYQVDFSQVEIPDTLLNEMTEEFKASESYHEFLAQIKIASENYLEARGLRASEKSIKDYLDGIKFEDVVPITEGTSYENYTITFPFEGSYTMDTEDKSASLKIWFKASVKMVFKIRLDHEINWWELVINTGLTKALAIESLSFHMEEITTLAFSFGIDFTYKLGQSPHTDYVYNTETKKLHRGDCASLNITGSGKIESITNTQLLEFYASGKYPECKRCKPISKLYDTCYLVNETTDTFHTSSCFHVQNHISEYTPYSVHEFTYEQMTAMYEACKDCAPINAGKIDQDEFDRLMQESLTSGDWSKTLQEITALSPKPSSKGKTFDLVDIPIPGPALILGANIDIDFVIDFTFTASLKYEFKVEKTIVVGFDYDKSDFFEGDQKALNTYSENPDPVILENHISLMGKAKLKMGLQFSLHVYVLSSEKIGLASIDVTANVGAYATLSGVLDISFVENKNTYAAAQLELGVYMQFSVQLNLVKLGNEEGLAHPKYSTEEFTFPLAQIGYDRAYYAFSETPDVLELTDTSYVFDPQTYLSVVYFDLDSFKNKTDVLSFAGLDGQYAVHLSLANGNTYCTIRGDRLLVNPDAPEEFTDTLRVTVSSLSDWIERGTNSVYYLGSYTVELHYKNPRISEETETDPPETETDPPETETDPPETETNPPESSGLRFTSNGDGTCYVSSIGTCTDTDIVIPSVSPAGDKVTSIGVSAFHGCSSLTSITIPDSVTSIGQYAFYYCSSLTGITIPDSVTWIGYDAFSYCSSLTSITIPDGVTIIVISAFSHCSSLTSITIPDSVTSIGQYAFQGCSSLTSITIPDSVTRICDYAFPGCSSLTSITIPDSVTSIGNFAFTGCSSLTSITIPDSVTSIGRSAFSDCSSLTSITIPDSVTSIDKYAFKDCRSLTSITFQGTTAQWTAIEKGPWWNDYTPSYTIHCTDGTIAKDGTITPNTPTYSSGLLFTSNGDGTCSVSGSAFSYTYTEVVIPSVSPAGDKVTSIGDGAFSGCSSLTSITIPDSITSIGAIAFVDCDNLTSITIPDSVTTIGMAAFFGCSSLTSITFQGTKAQWNAIDKMIAWTITIHCTDGDIVKE